MIKVSTNEDVFLPRERFRNEKRTAKSVKKKTNRPIVCGTDFSATATEAVDIAAAMARRLETRLVLVHVDQLLGSLVSDPVLLEAAILQRRRDLDDEAQRLRGLGNYGRRKISFRFRV